MFIKQTKAVNVYAYRMLLSFKTLVTYKRIFNFTLDNCVRYEAAFVGHNLIFMPNIVRCPVLVFRLGTFPQNVHTRKLGETRDTIPAAKIRKDI